MFHFCWISFYDANEEAIPFFVLQFSFFTTLMSVWNGRHFTANIFQYIS